MSVITRSLIRSGQDVELNAYHEFTRDHVCTDMYPDLKPVTLKLRVRIRRNAYDHQSFAVVEAWSVALTRWEQVAELNTANMACMVASYVRTVSKADEKAFADDESRLLTLAKTILR